MTLLEIAADVGTQLIAEGDPHRTVMLVTTPFHLATIGMAMAHYRSAMSSDASPQIVQDAIAEAQGDLDKATAQILDGAPS